MVLPPMTAPSQPDPLHEELWELVYGLVDDRRAAELIEQIRSDPTVARRYAEVRLQADLLRDAAKLQMPQVTLAPPADEAEAPPRPAKAVHPSAATGLAMWLQPAGWLAAAALLLLGLWCFQTPPAVPEVSLGAVEVETPRPLWAGHPGQLRLRTLRVEPEQVRPAPNVEVKLVAREGRHILHDATVRTGNDGQAEVDLPPEAVRPGTQLQVTLAEGPLSQAASGLRGTGHPLPDGSLQCELPVESAELVYELAAIPPLAPRRFGEATLWRIDVVGLQLLAIEPRETNELVAQSPLPQFAERSASTAALPGRDAARPSNAQNAQLAASAREEQTKQLGRDGADPSSSQQAELAASAGAPPAGAAGGATALAFRASPPVATRQNRSRQIGGPAGITFKVDGLKERYAPGEVVHLTIHATEDNGTPVQATVSARVWNERLLGPGAAPLLKPLLDTRRQGLPGDFVRLASSQDLVQPALREAVEATQRQAKIARWRGGLSLVALAAMLGLALVIGTAIASMPLHRSWAHLAPGLALVAASLLVALWGWQQRPVADRSAGALAMAPAPAGAVDDVPEAAPQIASSRDFQADGLAAEDVARQRVLLREQPPPPPTVLRDDMPSPAAPEIADRSPAPGNAEKAQAATPPLAASRALRAAESSHSAQAQSDPLAVREPQRRKEAPASPAGPTSLTGTDSISPATLYFNPQLQTDPQGQVRISFTLPPAPGRYRLLLDAIGGGKIDSAQYAIVCGP